MQSPMMEQVEQFSKNLSGWEMLPIPMQQELKTISNGVIANDDAALTQFHRLLAGLNKRRFALDTVKSPREELALDILRTEMETLWVNIQRAKIAERLKTVPTDPDMFIQWFEALEQNGYGQHHPLFNYLEDYASWDDFRYFMTQELATEAGFDDLVALTQIQAPYPVKVELATNYWDEMGNGKLEKMHSVQLHHVSEALDLTWQENYGGIHWQALALSNLMMAFASHRSWFNQSMGALGVIELTAPGRSKQVTEGMKRIGFTNYQYRYYALHAVLDIKHWQGWKENALVPLITESPERCPRNCRRRLTAIIGREAVL